MKQFTTSIIIFISILIAIFLIFLPFKNISSLKNLISTNTKPKIIEIKKQDKESFTLQTSSFLPDMWLCIQPDWYTKPINKRCNSGELIQEKDHVFHQRIDDNVVLKLYNNSNLDQLYDEVLITDFSSDNPQIRALTTKCGLLNQDNSGNFYINDIRLLTKPGWKYLTEFINKDVCVQGESYPSSKSLRVYFIQNN